MNTINIRHVYNVSIIQVSKPIFKTTQSSYAIKVFLPSLFNVTGF